MRTSALRKSLAVALVVGSLSVLPVRPASAQQVCPPYRNGVTLIVVGQEIRVPGHGIYCIDPSGAIPTVYDDNGTTVVSFSPYGTRTCVFGINTRCFVAVEI